MNWRQSRLMASKGGGEHYRANPLLFPSHLLCSKASSRRFPPLPLPCISTSPPPAPGRRSAASSRSSCRRRRCQSSSAGPTSPKTLRCPVLCLSAYPFARLRDPAPATSLRSTLDHPSPPTLPATTVTVAGPGCPTSSHNSSLFLSWFDEIID
uniref:Uncharacterized protein n=3 Tax=Opuntia streptacantha TaxID=393608 RepID=A0A7C9CZF3_OPUST